MFSLIAFVIGNAFSQSTGAIKGVIVDNSNQPLPGANVYLEVSGIKQGAVTDFDGNYTIKPLRPGLYNLFVSMMGFQTKEIQSVVVKSNEITFLKKVILIEDGILLGDAVVKYQEKLIKEDDPMRISVAPELLENLPNNRNIPSVIRSTSSEVNVSDDGTELYFKGSRNGASGFYIDGIKVASLENGLPSGMTGSFMMYSGGIPAEYGDVTGGVVVIESKSYFDILIERENRKKR